MVLNGVVATVAAPRVAIWADERAVRRALDTLAALGVDLTDSGLRPPEHRAAGLQVFDVSAERARLDERRLTARQLEVLHLVAAGASNSEIAVELAISHGTAEYHVRRILRALGVAGREQAVLVACRAGWLVEDQLDALLSAWFRDVRADPMPDLAATVLPAVRAECAA